MLALKTFVQHTKRISTVGFIPAVNGEAFSLIFRKQVRSLLYGSYKFDEPYTMQRIIASAVMIVGIILISISLA